MIFNKKGKGANVREAVSALVMILLVCTGAVKEAAWAEQGGDLLYRAKCASCHRVYPPKKYTYQKFQTYVAKYGKALTDDERRRLLEYLKENGGCDGQ